MLPHEMYLTISIYECYNITKSTLWHINLLSKGFKGYIFFDQDLFNMRHDNYINYIQFQLDGRNNIICDYIEKYNYTTINEAVLNNWTNHDSPNINSKYKKETIRIDGLWIKYKKWPFSRSLYNFWISPLETDAPDHLNKILLKKRLKLLDLE